MTIRLIPLLASGALLVSSGAALAQSATATADVNVRSGPGGQYEVVDQLPAGETVRVIDCSGEWCEISMGGESGFVARRHLDDGGGRRASARAYDDGDDYGAAAIEQDDPDAVAGVAIGGYYESRPFYIREGYYYWGGRWYARRPGVSGWRTSSWRRWEERRGPGASRGGFTNRPPRIDDRRARIDRDNRDRDGRVQKMERRDREQPADRGERGAGRDGGGRQGGGQESGGREGGSSASVDREGPGSRVQGPRENRSEQRVERRDGRTGGEGPARGAGEDRAGRTPGAGSNDRGDRVGLDRAGGGGNRDR